MSLDSKFYFLPVGTFVQIKDRRNDVEQLDIDDGTRDFIDNSDLLIFNQDAMQLLENYLSCVVVNILIIFELMTYQIDCTSR